MNFGGSGGNFEKPKPGTYAAVCFKVVDLGVQEIVFQGKKKHMPKMIIGWEIDEKMKDGRPFVVNKLYTKSMAETANLRKDLESWRGKGFSEDEISLFNESKILGKGCLLTLVESEDGKYVNIKTVTGLPKGMQAPDQINPNVVLSLHPDEFNQSVFDGLHDKLKAKIMLSPEWAMLKGSAVAAPVSDEESPAETEEVPF